MPLTDLMAAVRTVVSPAADRDTVLHTAADLLSCRQAGADELYANLCEREALGSTAIGHGIAIPHGRCPNLTEPRGALLRLDTPVAFGGDEPVDLIFAMAVPAHYTHQHLMLLSELAERFSDADFRQRLRAAPNAEALMGLLTDVPPLQASAA
ncbi:PTS sugar transporter subunit IIA [Xanthomonas oryzae]|uniref:PTS sugar transporter subunit IIA n=1 Tax=Xanthomonas oryzae TaxID=347 RepID=UPI001033CE24|nr:PTS sugar transporter subunit IIA [Xanthomonas oryzae]QBG96675.1 PTS sugar transporter subunit IIA [Xanthomonas oryzae]QBG99249.1 PTS sugar transporter subunit IIA [Xanthomonas oryzae]